TPEVTTLTSLGATQQYTATAIDANGNVLTGVVFQWASSNGAVASVNGTGLATALGAGATAISASANGVTGVAVLSVSLPAGPPLFIIVSPGSATLTALGATQQFTAIAFDSKGAIVPNVSFTWSSSNPAVATVSANGVATAVSPGSVSIVAAAAGRTGSASLSVTVPVVPASVLILGQRERPLTVGNSLQFTTEVRDANGNIMTGVTVTWQVLKPNIASIDPLTGVATGLVPGLTLIRASVGNLFDEVELVIRP
ncbi:MAG TPA: Ig-like domain-containing protein, partial [Gemmatimonadaceae bacterium]|nr:Ig-like domain-containing protein [Gemmatimonadaceae bacterium]